MNARIPSDGSEPSRLQKAIHDALAIFGDNSSAVLLSHLKDRYGIDIDSGKVVLGDLHSALLDLPGPGADVIMDAIRRNLA